MYVIVKGNLYVSKPGSKYSYTNKLQDARRFSSKEEAEKNKCGNESVISI